MRSVFLFIGLVAALIGGYGIAADVISDTMHPLAEWHGQYSGEKDRGFQVIHTERQFARIRLPFGATPHPIFDKTKHLGIAVYSGQRPTGGYGVRLLSASLKSGVLTLRVAESRPPPGTLVTLALTTPVVVVIFPRQTARVDVVWDSDPR